MKKEWEIVLTVAAVAWLAGSVPTAKVALPKAPAVPAMALQETPEEAQAPDVAGAVEPQMGAATGLTGATGQENENAQGSIQTNDQGGIRLDVPLLSQEPELPNGCEITSATAALQYYGFSVEPTTMADDFLPQSPTCYGYDPNEIYLGNPRLDSGDNCGFYCYPKPIVQAMNAYLATQENTSMQAQDRTGITLQEIKREVESGNPVVVWITLQLQEPVYGVKWQLPNGTYPLMNEHCVVVSGCGEHYLFITDPLQYTYTVSDDRFMQMFSAIGNHAVTLRFS